MKIGVKLRGEESEIQAPVGARLLDYLQAEGIPVNAACGGNGTCFKCRVKLEDGFLPPSARDRLAFREGELQAGWRLSCQARPKTNLRVEVPSTENLRGKPRLIWARDGVGSKAAFAEGKLQPRLVCDLGSTGVVVALIDAAQGVLLETHLLNRQVRFGADVMTRLAHAQKAGVEPLRDAVLETLRLCLESLNREWPEAFATASPQGVICAGNSAMTSFLMEMSIETLAVAPFQPSSREARERVLSGAFGEIRLLTLPLLAGFVGGDTVAGILVLEDRKTPEPWMLVDIGTNTEIVVANGRGELWFSSAPAGPAFEGGNISQGMRAETGAISEACWEGDASTGRWKLATIGGDVAKGICGSGLMDLLFEGVRAGLIARDGYLEGGRLDVTPEIGLLADDVREFQLAKSATRTAADLLIERAGVRPQRIYLAGTFAQHLRPDSVRGIGLLPEGIPFEMIGNASLEGAAVFARMSEPERMKFLTELEARRHPVELALQDDFQAAFVKNLDF